MRALFTILSLSLTSLIYSQKLDVEGDAKIQTTNDNTKDSVLVTDGNGVIYYRDLSTMDDADADPTNEKISSIMIVGDSLTIVEGGTTMKVAADSSNTNEIQNLAEILAQDSSAANNRIKDLGDPISPQDAATRAYVDLLLGEIAYLKGLAGISNVTDIEGNIYQTIKIGNQVWMAENLRTTKYNDSTPVPKEEDGGQWAGLSTPAYCWHANDSVANASVYGALYNYYVVADTNSRNVCPAGWDVPTDAEWTVLTDYLTNNGYGYQGSGADIGKSMASTSRWTANTIVGAVGNDQGTNNASGFSGFPDGYRLNDGQFNIVGSSGHWWSSTEFGTNSWSRSLVHSNDGVVSSNSNRRRGYSVRCVRD